MSAFSQISELLLYPERPPAVEEPAGEPVRRFLDAAAGRPLEELRREYVETFDFDRRTSLHLTYHLYGDRRRRGIELVRLKRRFLEAGLELEHGELPDYLPVLLEFAALEPARGGTLLAELRGAIELVRSALHERGSPYAHLLDGVAAALPNLTRKQADAVRRLAAEGPPTEQVGLDSFTPPELAPFLAGSVSGPAP